MVDFLLGKIQPIFCLADIFDDFLSIELED